MVAILQLIGHMCGFVVSCATILLMVAMCSFLVGICAFVPALGLVSIVETIRSRKLPVYPWSPQVKKITLGIAGCIGLVGGVLFTANTVIYSDSDINPTLRNGLTLNWHFDFDHKPDQLTYQPLYEEPILYTVTARSPGYNVYVSLHHADESDPSKELTLKDVYITKKCVNNSINVGDEVTLYSKVSLGSDGSKYVDLPNKVEEICG